MLTWCVCLKKCIHVKIILKNLIQRKKLSICLLAIHCSQIVHLMQQKNKLDCCKGEDCMERFVTTSREHAMKIIDYEKKEMIPLTDEENKSYEKQNVCYICKKEFNTDDDDYKQYHKVRDHCHYTGKFRRAAHNICNLRYKTPKKITVIFHNGSTYGYHFIV